MAKKDGKKTEKAEKADKNSRSDETDTGKAPIPKPPAPATVTTTSSGSGPADDLAVGGGPAEGFVVIPSGDAAETVPEASPGSSAPLIVDSTTSVEALSAPAGQVSAPAGARSGLQLARTSDLASGVAYVLRAPLQIAGRALPADRTSMVLGVAALTLVGVLDWPGAIATGLGYEALRRWAPTSERTRTP